MLGVAVAAFLSLKTPFNLPAAEQSSLPCAPQPCADVRGFTLWVTDLKTEGGLVSMQLRFKNASNATHADPSDISLVDSQKADSAPVYDAPGCTRWSRAEFSNGAFFGPVRECFRPGNPGPPLSLRWTPDFGPFCCEVLIPLG